MRGLTRAKVWIDGIVSKLLVLDQMLNYVDTESIDTASQPETHDVVYRRAQLGIPPIEIRLGAQERVTVKLSSERIELPGAAPELG